MKESILDYWKEELWPRLKVILSGTEFWLAALMAIAFAFWGANLDLSRIKTGVVVTAALNYSAIAFGFAVTGMTLAISIPHRALAIKMAKEAGSCPRTNSYSDLLFVFSWTALAHLAAILMFIGVILFVPDDTVLMSKVPSSKEQMLSGVIIFMLVYCLGQFCITIITLSQVGKVFIDQLKLEKTD